MSNASRSSWPFGRSGGPGRSPFAACMPGSTMLPASGLRSGPRRALMLGSLGLALSVAAGAQPQPQPQPAAAPDAASFQRQAQALIDSRVQPDGPGVAVLVARGDTVLLRSARGMASIELGVPLQPQHVFRVASITKQFAAAALLQQVQAGKLGLGTPLAAWLPGFPNGANISVAQLLNHTSGIQSYTNLPSHMAGPIRHDMDTAALVQVFRDLPPEFTPGAGYAYNNSGYVLVGALLEAVTGKPWHAAVRDMLQPLAMPATVWGDGARGQPGMAQGYSRGADGAVQRASFISMTQPHAAGALLSTVDDLWRWNRALHGGKVLNAELHARMLTPEGEAAKANYGYGIGVARLRGERAWTHGGGINGYTSALLYLPDQQLSVVVLHNSDRSPVSADALARQLAALALGRPYPDGPTAQVAPARMQALAGLYRRVGGSGAATETRTLRFTGSGLTSQRGQGSVFALRPLSEQLWLIEGSTTALQVEPGEAPGRPLRLRAMGDAPDELWERVGDAPEPPPAPPAPAR